VTILMGGRMGLGGPDGVCKLTELVVHPSKDLLVDTKLHMVRAMDLFVQ